MATPTKTIYSTSDGFNVGQFRFGKHGQNTGSTAQIVHDGDTVNVFPFLNFGSRFLGVDAPEKSFTFPNSDDFVSIENQKWKDFFSNNQWQNPNLPNKLKQHLATRINPQQANVAINHAFHEDKATKGLEKMIADDLLESGKTKDEFLFFSSFGYEILDGYGRLLCYLYSEMSNFTPPRAKLSYNEQLLIEGLVTPYFIFPNIQPFLKGSPFKKEEVTPVKFWQNIRNASKLQKARTGYKNARISKKGVFTEGNELIIYPFELRFLGRGKSADRYVIDLSKDDGTNKKIFKPENYFEIPNEEDRLFLPEQYVPLFRENGWRFI